MRTITKICMIFIISIACVLPMNTAFADTFIAWNWMSTIPDATKISEITIPGSHDSASSKMRIVAGSLGEVQNYTIQEQLDGGIRLFDLRVGGPNEQVKKLKYKFPDPKDSYDLYLYHGDLEQVDCKCYDEFSWVPWGKDKALTFRGELDRLVNFVKVHPSETVLVAPRAETGNKSLVYKYIKEAILDYSQYIYMSRDRVPTLGEVRGKVVLLDIGYNLGIGLPLSLAGSSTIGDTTFATSDYFECSSTEDKINVLKYAFDEAREKKGGVIFTSGYTKVLGKLPNSLGVSKAVNPNLPSMLKNREANGWIFSDFVKPAAQVLGTWQKVKDKVNLFKDNVYAEIGADDIYMKNF